jgi:hypothetical protein
MGRNGSQAVHHALDLQTRVAEVDQSAELQACCLEIVDALQAMRLVQCVDGFEFGQNCIFGQQVYEIIGDHRPVVCGSSNTLLGNGESCLTQFMRRRIFIDLFQKPGPECIEHIEGAADDNSGQRVQLVCVLRVHLLVSA